MADLLTSIFSNPDRMPRLTPREWEDVIGQSRRSMLLARLGMHMNDRGWVEQMPTAAQPFMAGALRMGERQGHEVRWELEQIQRAIARLGCPVVVLKGAAYLAANLPPSRGRLFSDIDILVPRASIAHAEGALLAAGWLPQKLDAYDDQYYRTWMHEIPPLIHIHRFTAIDLHHTIAPPTSRYKIDGSLLLERAVPLADWPGLSVLAPEDMVLHSAVHLFQEGEFDHGLRDLLDMNDLLRHFSIDQAFWPTLLDRARELKLGVPLHHALFHVGRLFGTQPPAELATQVAKMHRSSMQSSAMAYLLTIGLRPNHPTCDSWQTPFARWVLYVRSHYLRMPPHQAIPHLIRKGWMRRFPAKPVVAP